MTTPVLIVLGIISGVIGVFVLGFVAYFAHMLFVLGYETAEDLISK